MDLDIKTDEPIDKTKDIQSSKYSEDDWTISGLMEVFWNFLLSLF